jgi:hypothetical protein
MKLKLLNALQPAWSIPATILALFATGCVAETLPSTDKQIASQPAPASVVFQRKSPLEWSAAMADSETARTGDRLVNKGGARPRWDYTAGLFTLSLIKLGQELDKPEYIEFAEKAIGSFISKEGQIATYRVDVQHRPYQPGQNGPGVVQPDR